MSTSGLGESFCRDCSAMANPSPERVGPGTTCMSLRCATRNALPRDSAPRTAPVASPTPASIPARITPRRDTIERLWFITIPPSDYPPFRLPVREDYNGSRGLRMTHPPTADHPWHQLFWLLILAIPIACIARTVVFEELFREPRDWCHNRSQNCRTLFEKKFFYIFTCEYCF